jgi:hypothetical protein
MRRLHREGVHRWIQQRSMSGNFWLCNLVSLMHFIMDASRMIIRPKNGFYDMDVEHSESAFCEINFFMSLDSNFYYSDRDPISWCWTSTHMSA